MKNYLILIFLALATIGCNGQQKDDYGNRRNGEKETQDKPGGSWKVNKEFDEQGNLIRYDSIYSWSSATVDPEYTKIQKDSLIEEMQSKFNSFFLDYQENGQTLIPPQLNDSLMDELFFNDDFFESDFGRDFMDLKAIQERMKERQQRFLDKYKEDLKQALNKKA